MDEERTPQEPTEEHAEVRNEEAVQDVETAPEEQEEREEPTSPAPPQPPPLTPVESRGRSSTAILWGIGGGLLVFFLLTLLFALFLAYRNTQRELASLRKEVNVHYDNVDSKILDLSNQIIVHDKEMGKIHAELKTLKEEISDLRDDLASLEEESNNQARETEKALQELEDRLKEMSTSLQATWQHDLQEEKHAREKEIRRLQLEILLMRASRQALEARIHLKEKSRGLAKRDLRTVADLLDQAATLAKDDPIRGDILRLRGSIEEIRNTLEHDIFPVTTVELFIDRLDELLDQVREGKLTP